MLLPRRVASAPDRPYPEAPAPTWDGQRSTYALWAVEEPKKLSAATGRPPITSVCGRRHGGWRRLLRWRRR